MDWTNRTTPRLGRRERSVTHTVAFNRDLGVIVVRVRQSMDAEEIEAAFRALADLPEFVPGLKLLVDFRDSQTLLAAIDVRRLAQHASESDCKWGDTRWALLARDDYTYGLARMFETHTQRHKVTTHVFPSFMTAATWLALGLDLTEILSRTPERLPQLDRVSGQV